ncbi:unnamed protein product [Meganyctiphanes norvegica]|uniref:Uncharacterized protein n=1 Tax=Meganyctiphanes norvegica TaxID=48144 RepID=A0AAV2QI15_MEGNR
MLRFQIAQVKDSVRWDEYNPPTPVSKGFRPVSQDQLDSIKTPSMNNSDFDCWSVGDNLSRANVPVNEWSGASSPSVSSAAKTSQSKSKVTVITMDDIDSSNLHSENEDISARGSYILPKKIIETNVISNSPCSTVSKDSNNQKDHHPPFNFLPAKKCLQVPGTSRTLSHTSMNSFWADYERTATGDENLEYDCTPMQKFNIDGSNSAFEIESIMEPDSLEKSINPSIPICDRSVKKKSYNSNTVASCLPNIFKQEYSESPPYMPSQNFNFGVANTGWSQSAVIPREYNVTICLILLL